MKKNNSIFISILAILLLIVLGIIAINVAPIIKNFIYDLNILKQINEIVTQFKILGIPIIILSQFIQVFLVIIPSEPIELISGMTYGGFLGCVLCFIGATLGTVLIFIITRKYQSNTLSKIYNKYQKQFKTLQKGQNIETIIFILYLVPGLPKEFFSYFVGLTPISLKKFLIISSIARFPSIISSTIGGASLIKGNIELPIILFISTSIFSIIGVFIYKKIQKK